MSIYTTAAADLEEIINDTETGGDTISITSPAGASETFKRLGNDIHLSFDPGTGETVCGRQSSASVLISELIEKGFNGIRGVADSTSKPWLVDATDVNGVAGTFKVAAAHPDHTLGLMLLTLEGYKSL